MSTRTQNTSATNNQRLTDKILDNHPALNSILVDLEWNEVFNFNTFAFIEVKENQSTDNSLIFNNYVFYTDNLTGNKIFKYDEFVTLQLLSNGEKYFPAVEKYRRKREMIFNLAEIEDTELSTYKKGNKAEYKKFSFTYREAEYKMHLCTDEKYLKEIYLNNLTSGC